MRMCIGRTVWLGALLLGACQPRSCSERIVAARAVTNADIALQNLSAQIDELERAHDRSPEALQFTTTLVGLLQTRAQYQGRLSDYDRALALAEGANASLPRNAGALLLRAGVRSSLHQFSEALSDLDRAISLGAEADASAELRASILQAQGHLPEALALWRKLESSSSDIHTLGLLAVAEGESGNPSEAQRLFSAAVQRYRDVSPFPLAWIEFQQGLMWERAGELAKAQSRYESARVYLPQYAPATGHLASLLALRGENDKAVELLLPLAKGCEDPEYAGQLAVVLVQLGDLKQASRHQLALRQRYDDLAQRHPEAFADHAARFWLGENPGKALAYARQNLENRKTPDAFDLAISAALAASEKALACELADEALGLPRPPPRIHVLAGRAFAACGLADRAEQERSAAFGPRPVR